MKTVVWKGFFEGDSGYIHASQRYPLATILAGFSAAVAPLTQLHPQNPLNNILWHGQGESLGILHQIPTVSPKEEGYFTVTEFDVAPHEWWNSLRKAKVILTQSKFCKEIFSKIDGVDKQKIKIVYYPQAESYNPKGETIDFKLENNPFIFGSCYEWVARKKPELMWQAFTEEFDKNENVVFINKMSIPQGFSNWRLIFNQYQQKDPRIKLLSGFIPDMGRFYRGLDCYVGTSAGEGWGATLSEAMGCGTPTIGSRHAGCLEFMNDKNSWLVDVGKWEPIGDDPTNHLWMVHDYQQWKLPKVESIRKAMREIYTLGKAAKQDPRTIEGTRVTDMCNIKNIAGQMNKALVDYL